MVKLEEKGIMGIKGVIFDLYNTLIDIRTDEESISTYEQISKWLIYQGVKISADDLKNEYKRWLKKPWIANGKSILKSRWNRSSSKYAKVMPYGISMRPGWALRPLAPFGLGL